MTIKFFDDFITQKQCNQLYDWTYENRNKKFFMPVGDLHGRLTNRTTTRFYNQYIDFPELAYTIRKNIDQLTCFDQSKLPPFYKGIYSGLQLVSEGSEYSMHTDPVYYDDTITVHCNIVVNQTVGGELYTNDSTVEMQQGRLVIIPVSEISHGVRKLKYDMPRNLWVFGYCISKDRWLNFLTSH